MCTNKLALLLLFVALVPLAGCGNSNGAPAVTRDEDVLKQIYAMYRHHIKSQERPPAELEDLAKRQYEGNFPGAVRALTAGEYIVVWNVNSKDSGTVLAYEKDVPEKGGAVLMADGAVKTMSVAQFQSAKSSP